MNQGVEWAMHVLLSLAWAGDDRPVPTAQLAASYDLPQAYLHKQMQALARAGIVESLPGAHGGFLLARPPEKITLMDVVAAIEGKEPAFVCMEIRHTCAVNAAMQRAELQWRKSLASQTIADVKAAADAHAPSAARLARQAYGRD